MTHPVHGYAEAVAAGRVPACRATRWACERHLRDLETGHERGLVWSDEAAQHALKFVERYGHHYEGPWAGNPLILEPFQRWKIGAVFGWLTEEKGLRRFSTVYWEETRKTGKTLLISALGYYGLVADSERGAQVWTAASTRGQCGPVFRGAWKMRDASPELRAATRTSPDKPNLDNLDERSKIYHDASGSWWGTLTRDSDKIDSLNPHFALVDEVHVHPDGGIIDTLRSGMGARPQPILFMITSAGKNPVGFGRTMHDDMVALLNPETGVEDDSTFACVWAVDEDDDPLEDEACWPKACPNLGVSVFSRFLRDEVTAAKNRGGAKRREVLSKQFGVWPKTAGDAAILPAHWDACRGGEVYRDGREYRARLEAELAGAGGAAGLDLAATQDMTATCVAVERGDLVFWFLRYFTPADGLAERQARDRVPYDRWVEGGWLHVHPGAVVDIDEIELSLLADCARFGVRTIGFDPWNARASAQHLAAAGLETVEIRQGFAGMAGPTKDTLDLVAKGRVCHGGHPILAWNAGCAITHTHASGAVRLVREDAKHGRRVDGLQAAVMATGRLLLSPAARQSGYATWRQAPPAEGEAAAAPQTAAAPAYRRRSGYATWRRPAPEDPQHAP